MAAAAKSPMIMQAPTTPPAMAPVFELCPDTALAEAVIMALPLAGHCLSRDVRGIEPWLPAALTTCSPEGICPHSPGFPAAQQIPSLFYQLGQTSL